MPGKRATPEARKEQIIAAADQVLVEVGLEAFTVEQVSARAGIAKGTIYQYYHNKDEMLAEVVVRALHSMQTYFEEAVNRETESIAQFQALCRACYQFYRHHPHYFALISYMERPAFDIDTSGYLRLSQELQQFTQSLIERGQARGEIKAEYDPSMVHYIVWASCVAVVEFVDTKQRLLQDHHFINTEAMIETFASILTRGMAT